MAQGVAFVSQKEQIDTSTPAGRFMLSVFASLAQFEREQILARASRRNRYSEAGRTYGTA